MTDRTDRPTVAVMVTHNGIRHLAAQLDSMATQSRPLDRVVVLDDASHDGTLDVLLRHRDRLPLEVHPTDTPRNPRESTFARIGRNFREAVRLAGVDRREIVLFADQDDVWEHDRVAHQVSRIGSGAVVSAATAHCIDTAGTPTGRLLDEAYPRPVGFGSLSPADQLGVALRTPVATGAAMAVDGAFLRRAPEPPAGWLHDRWYSLCAAAHGGLDIDPTPVIRYRIHDAQAVGTSGAGSAAASQRIAAWSRRPRAIVRRLRDIRRLEVLAHEASVRAALQPGALVGTMVRRAIEAAA